MGTKEIALRKALAEEGILIAPEGKYPDRLRVGEQRLNVLRLSRQSVGKITGGTPLQKWGHWAQAKSQKLFTDSEGVALPDRGAGNRGFAVTSSLRV
jgi:hypothetical protein